MANQRYIPIPNNYKNNIKCSIFNCLSPFVFAIFVFVFLIWLLFEVPVILPVKPEPPSFLWHSRLSRNITPYIIPDKNTLIITPKVQCSSRTELVFIVPSSVNNTYKREAIRNTWGRWVRNDKDMDIPKSLKGENVTTKTNREMKLFFILGKDEMWNEGEIDDRVLAEAQRYDDIIMEDFVDTYLNLTLKSIFMLKWINSKCPRVKYIMKADDDMFINIPNLEVAVSNSSLKSPLLMGTLICNARPIKNRWSKWYSPTYMFSGRYPNYLSGTAYLLSGDLVNKLLTAAIQTPYFHLEDVYITGMCAKKIGVRPVNHRSFSYLKRAFNPCIYKDIITGHEVTITQMKLLWNMLHNKTLLAKCKPIPSKILYPLMPKQCKWK